MNRLILVLSIGLFACNSTADRQKMISEKFQAVNVPVAQKRTILKDCVRGAAKPIIKRSVYPKTTFVLQPDSLSGVETVTFENGDQLTIKNWGCEYYILTFRFETSRLQQDTINLGFWFKSAASLTTEVLDGLEAPIDIRKGIGKLVAYVEKKPSLKLGEKIDFEAGDIHSFVSVDRVEKITDKKYAVEISFATGPL